MNDMIGSLRVLAFLMMMMVVSGSCHFSNHVYSDSVNQQNNDTMNREENLPAYVELHKQGVLKQRGDELWQRMDSCDLCPRNCSAKRLEGERGVCRANSTLEVASFSPHFGEEPELVGRGGSGTIFFTNCALNCVFCINADISQMGYGRQYSIDDLADMMIALQKRGCHNINLVTPTHYVAHILLALDKAVPKGLTLPIVYNTCGWEKTDVLPYLDSVVDIYLTDFKYGCNETATIYSPGASDYVEMTRAAHLMMQEQVGTARVDTLTGLMQRGLMIRHLVMPNDVTCTKNIMEWIAQNLPEDTYINIMSQYTPVFRANRYPEINRRITRREYVEAVKAAEDAGLKNIQVQ